jgi:hypothetical protein
MRTFLTQRFFVSRFITDSELKEGTQSQSQCIVEVLPRQWRLI